jgi:hypothetical protein
LDLRVLRASIELNWTDGIMVSNGLARQNLVVGVSTALTAISGKIRWKGMRVRTEELIARDVL